MPVLFAITGSALGCFAEGAILGASVYLVSRGVRNPLKNHKYRSCRTHLGQNISVMTERS